MKINTRPNEFSIEFSGGSSGVIKIEDIITIDIENMPTMSIYIDYITLGYKNGEFIEIADNAEGFKELCEVLSSALEIEPPIQFRFPVQAESGIDRIYQRPITT